MRATAGAARAAGGRADPTARTTLAPGSREAGCQNADGSGQHWGGPCPGRLTKAVSQAKALAAGLPTIPAGGGDPRARACSVTLRLHRPWRACPEASSVPSTKACPNGGPALQDGLCGLHPSRDPPSHSERRASTEPHGAVPGRGRAGDGQRGSPPTPAGAEGGAWRVRRARPSPS